MPTPETDMLFYADADGGVICEVGWVDPEIAFLPHGNSPHALWLDSSDADHALSRASYIATAPYEIISGPPEQAQQFFEQARAALMAGAGTWDKIPAKVDACLPTFRGGLAGFFGYDLASGLHPMPENISRMAQDDLNLPGLVLGLYPTVVAFDNQARRTFIIATGLPGTSPDDRRQRAEQDIACWQTHLNPLRDPHPAAKMKGNAARITGKGMGEPANLPHSDFAADEFKQVVENVVTRILDGEIFQANIAQRFHAHLDAADTAFDYYRRLRQLSPAPFSAFACYDGWALASASPERFLACTDGDIESRPIKGTRPRGATPEEDQKISADLLASEKDRAENTMIVDLLRNDLAKNCVDNSIEVPQLCVLERFSNVHHLVSTVRGCLRPGTTPLDALRDSFPGGSITGAPKIQAMGVIAELERHARGPYCGAMGYIGFDGHMDTNILIRTAVIMGRDIYFQVGGGIVADSHATAEYEETLDKASGLMAALTSHTTRVRSA